MKARFASVALLGVVLIAAAACGGSDGLTSAEEEALQERLEAAEAAEAEAERLRQEAEAAEAQAEAEAKAAQEAQEKAEADAKAAQEAKEKAEADAKAAEEAREKAEAEAQEAREKAEAEEAERQRQAQAAAAAEAERQRQAEAAAEAERLRQAAQQQQQQLQQQLTEAEQAELRARASSFGLQLDLGDGTTGPTAPTTVSGTATVSWKRGNTLTFKPEGTLDPGSAAPSVPGGWRSAGFTGHSGTANALIDETVYLYTNIQAPRSRNFWKVHQMEETDRGLEVAAASATDLNTDTDNNDPTPTGTARVFRVGNTPLDHGDGATYDIVVSGTYDGVSGIYTCPDCTIVDGPDADSVVTVADFDADDWVMLSNNEREFVTGNWSFKPGSITTLVKAEDLADQDDAFLYFGIWSSIPDNISGTGYNFRYVADGGAQTGSALLSTTGGLAGFAALVGPATFRGGAVGMYTTQGQVGGQNAKIGTFTATATLNADFTANTLSGSITDFREGGSPLAGWRVTMGSTGDVGVAANIALSDTADDASGSTVANVGGLSVGGSWGANFYGSNNQSLLDRDKYPATQYPPVDLAGVAGWFDAVGPGDGGGVNDVALAGAFGATPQ